MFPGNGAGNVCVDSPLRLTFNGAPVIGQGKIKVLDASDNAVVQVVDVAARVATRSIGGLPNFSCETAIVSGNGVTIYLPEGSLAYNRTYYVTIDAGAFKTDNGNYAGIANTTDWRFTTKAAPPAAGTTTLTVAADGSGDFCTVQGAIDRVPDGNTSRMTIFLRRGTYVEIVCCSNKHALTFTGEDREQCVITYANNARFNPASDQGNYRRSVFLAAGCNDLVIGNLTIRNTTPSGGSQAEALILNGGPASRALVADVNLYSFQDTLQINGQAYVNSCFIEGDVDFMWGQGPCFFENCRCHGTRSRAYFTQVRNPSANHGFVYHHCTFDGPQGVTGMYLARIDPARFPHSEVVLLDCALGPAVSPLGWLLNDDKRGATAPSAPPDLHFWEYNSHGPGGNAVDVSRRLDKSRQLRSGDDARLIADYSTPSFVLGNNWEAQSDPDLPPEAAGGDSGASPALNWPAAALPKVPDKTFSIADFGAVADGKTPATDALVKAIEAAHQAGGGTVRVPAGRYVTSPFSLTSKLNLHLDQGATLLLVNDLQTYPHTARNYTDWITANECTDISITGEGTIDGQGRPWWDKYRKRDGVVPTGLLHRPHMIRLSACSRVLIKDVTLTNSPMFHLVPDDCEDVTIDHVTIRAPADAPNTDGIDPSGWNYHISRCTLDVGDDNIAVKGHKSARPGRPACEHLLVENCGFLHGHGMSVGGQTVGGVRGLLVRNCTFDGTEAGIRLKAARGEGGLVEDCSYEKLTMRNVKVPIYITSYYSGVPGDIDSDSAQPVSATTPIWRNIRITDVTAAQCPEAGRVLGLPEMPISDLIFTNVHLSGGRGLRIVRAKHVEFVKSSIKPEQGPALVLHDAEVSGLGP